MYTALYRRYRPETFESVVGQDHIVRILKNQISSGTLAHAYMFCGTRGTGKTTVARILAKAVNCLSEGERPCGECENCKSIKNGNFIDVIEIDAASNNRVENIRDLNENVNYAPMGGRKKVYIIDEVHMLSKSAFNALLKTLEEPPETAMFILATTEPQKVPITIMSRCLRLDFRRVSEAVLTENLGRICAAEGVQGEPEAIHVIAVNADGSVRDSLSLLEQCLAAGGRELKYQDVVDTLGLAGETAMLELTDLVAGHDTVGALLKLDQMLSAGTDVRQFMNEWLAHFRNLLISRYIADPTRAMDVSNESAARLRAQSEKIEEVRLGSFIRQLSRTINDARRSPRPRVLLELCLVNMSQGQMAGNRGNGDGAGIEAANAASVRFSDTNRSARLPDMSTMGRQASAQGSTGLAPGAHAPGAAGVTPAGLAPGAPAPAPATQTREMEGQQSSLQGLTGLAPGAHAPGAAGVAPAGLASGAPASAQGSTGLAPGAAGVAPAGLAPGAPAPAAQTREMEGQQSSLQGLTGLAPGVLAPAAQALGVEERPSSPPASQDTARLNEDLPGLWQEIVADAASQRGSFRMLERGAFIKGIFGNECVIAATNMINCRTITNETAFFRQLFEKHTGNRFIIKCVVEDLGGPGQRRSSRQGPEAPQGVSFTGDESQEPPAYSAEELQAIWSQNLGIEVEVK